MSLFYRPRGTVVDHDADGETEYDHSLFAHAPRVPNVRSGLILKVRCHRLLPLLYGESPFSEPFVNLNLVIPRDIMKHINGKELQPEEKVDLVKNERLHKLIFNHFDCTTRIIRGPNTNQFLEMMLRFNRNNAGRAQYHRFAWVFLLSGQLRVCDTAYHGRKHHWSDHTVLAKHAVDVCAAGTGVLVPAKLTLKVGAKQKAKEPTYEHEGYTDDGLCLRWKIVLDNDSNSYKSDAKHQQLVVQALRLAFPSLLVEAFVPSEQVPLLKYWDAVC